MFGTNQLKHGCFEKRDICAVLCDDIDINQALSEHNKTKLLNYYCHPQLLQP